MNYEQIIALRPDLESSAELIASQMKSGASLEVGLQLSALVHGIAAAQNNIRIALEQGKSLGYDEAQMLEFTAELRAVEAAKAQALAEAEMARVEQQKDFEAKQLALTQAAYAEIEENRRREREETEALEQAAAAAAIEAAKKSKK